MGSLYLSKLNYLEREELKKKMHRIQNGKCFICEEPIDLDLQKDAVDIDHIVPLASGGKDDESNFALTHNTCNRSKQDSDLYVARILKRFDRLKEKTASNGRSINLSDLLEEYGGGKYQLSLKISNNSVEYSFNELDSKIYKTYLYKDPLSGFEYFFTVLPIEYIFHDDRINPRPLGINLGKLVKEFYRKRPQLHISLAWIDTIKEKKVKVFDGQHKAAAQILLGVKELPVRIFVNPDLDMLLTANTNAGTTLRQVAFDKSVQRHLGNSLYIDRVEQFQKDHYLSADDFSFSEKDLVTYFKGESKEMKRYILDAVRDSITHNQDNKLKDFIDFGGRSNEKPISYSTVEKTFYSFFIYQEVLTTPLNYKLEEGENPRELEKTQILELMNIIADEIFIGKFDPELGTYRIENRIQSGENIPLSHLVAYRVSKEEIMYNWLKYIQQIIKNFFIMQGKPIDEKKLFQYKFPPQLWESIRTFVKNFKELPIWKNKELSNTIFGGKQNHYYWQTIFETGKTPQGVQVLSDPINLMEMIKKKL